MASFADEPGLALERTISLGKVSGRIDHLAIDLACKRLFVSELGNNSVAVVDLQSGRVIRQIDGRVSRRESAIRAKTESSPLQTRGMEACACSGRMIWLRREGSSLVPTPTISAPTRQDGWWLATSGGLAVLDAATGQKVADIRLTAHPEGFQIDPRRNRIYVNLPTAHQVAVVDYSSGRIVAKWGLWLAVGNFPMALR